jgi:phenylacetate-CoA ligase
MRSSAFTPFRVIWKRSVFERRSRITRAELVRRQQRRLAELRRFTLERSPFYRKFHSGRENAPLAELPILTKATMMENFDALVTDRRIGLADAEAHLRDGGSSGTLRDFVVLSTSGSTGLRGVFLFSPREWIDALGSITRPMLWAGLTGGFQRPPRIAMIASRTPWHYSAKVADALHTKLAPTLRLDAGEPTDEMVRRLNEWQPEVIGGYPSALRQLAEEQIAGRLRVKPRGIGTSAEVLTEEARRRIRQAWDVGAFDTYGATEYAPIAAECAHGRKHLFEDNAIIESSTIAAAPFLRV